MSKAIVAVRPNDWAMIKEIAPVAATARMFGVTEPQAAIVMLKGYELGLGLAAAFEFIHVIDGKPSVSPKGALALIHQSGELKELKIEDFKDSGGNPTECSVYMERTSGFRYGATYSMEDAKRAGIVKPGSGWEKYPANMLRWRAVGYCADVVFPDVIGGMLRPEELGAEVDEGGEPLWSEVTTTIPPLATVEGAVSSKPQLQDMPTIPTPSAELIEKATMKATLPATIDALLAAGYTAEQIVVANEGIIPATAEDCQRVAKILEEQEC